MGMFTPTPRVSVPLTTLSIPLWASFSQSSRYFGSSPAWCRPMPWESSRRMSLPNGESNRASVSVARSASFSSRVVTLAEVSAWACSAAARWEKLTR